MVSNPLGGLTAQQRAMIPHIRGMVAQGVSGNQIQRNLQSAGTGLQRTAIQAIVREARLASGAAVREFTPGGQLRYVRKDFRPDPSRFAPAITELRREYSLVYEIEGTDSNTGAPTKRHITVSTDRLLTRAEFDAEAQELFDADPDSYGIEATGMTVVEARRA
tara:strand:+ start:73 stop:561 length:489 start_codon:yes stop_codon:yes gene_type:complete